jgi:polysaccharide deacetylase 2 family uncharacterized protein YibQ
VRRLLRLLARATRPRTLVAIVAVVLSLAVIAAAVTGPPKRSTANRTDPVLRALGLPAEETEALAATEDPVPTLSGSPRFVLPIVREPERWALRGPLRPPPDLVARAPDPPPAEAAPAAPATVARPAPPPRPAPAVVPRPPVAAPQLAALVVPRLPPPRRSAPPPGGPPRLAIIIDDIGPAVAHSQRAVRLPTPVTLAFLPYAEGLDGMVATAKAHGHEIFLHLPMEPTGEENPGPNAILVGLDPDERRRRLEWAFSRLPAAEGVNNHMGSRATSDPASMLQVLREVQRRNLPWVDSRTSSLSVGDALAERLGMRHAARDVFLDNLPTPEAVRRQLDQAERLARRRGHAIAIGHPFPATLGVLETWLPEAERRGLRIVHAGELIPGATCRPEVIPVGGCAGEDCPPVPTC